MQFYYPINYLSKEKAFKEYSCPFQRLMILTSDSLFTVILIFATKIFPRYVKQFLHFFKNKSYLMC